MARRKPSKREEDYFLSDLTRYEISQRASSVRTRRRDPSTKLSSEIMVPALVIGVGAFGATLGLLGAVLAIWKADNYWLAAFFSALSAGSLAGIIILAIMIFILVI